METHANPVETTKKNIYIITNDINDMVYIGQTTNVHLRFKQHCKPCAAADSLISDAIQRYGKEHFSVSILEHDVENYDEREIYWISKYNSIAPNGYNVSNGGSEPPHKYGEDSPQSKMSNEVVIALKNDLAHTDLSFSSIAEKYGISKRQVMRINQGVSRCDIKAEYPLRKQPNINGKLDQESVDLIIDLLRYSYFLNGEIARMFGVEVHAISKINDGIAHHREGVAYPIRKWKSCGTMLFTYEQVTEILDLLQNSDMSMNQIAKRYNVYVQSIMMINNGSSKKYRREGVKYPIRSFSGSVTTIPVKGSRRATDTRVEREAP